MVSWDVPPAVLYRSRSADQQDGILQITPSGSAEGCIEPDNAFRICFSDPEQGVAWQIMR